MTGMAAFEVLTNPIAVALALYVVVAILGAVLVQPIRLALVDRAEQFLAEPQWNAAQREEINLLLDTSMSFLVGLLIPVAVLGVALDEVLRRHPPCSEDRAALIADPRFDGIMFRYMISIAAANPLATVAALILMVVCALSLLPFTRRGLRDLLEAPILIASDRMAGNLQLAA